MNPPTFDSRVKQQIKQQDLLVKELPLFHKNFTQLISLLLALDYAHGDCLFSLLGKALIPEDGRKGACFWKPALFANWGREP